MSLRIDDDRLRRKLEEKELNGQNPVQGPQGQQGNPQNGGVTETGLPVSVVEDAKQTNVFSAAQRAQNTEGAGAASVGAPQPQDPGLSTQFDGVPNQPTGDITVQPPNTSGQQLLSSSLRGAESNDGSDPQGGATDEQKQQRYQASQDANLTSIAYSGNGESTAPTPSGLNTRLGITAPASGGVDAAGGSDGTGEATLTAGNEAADGTKNTGEATLATDTQPETGDTTNQNGADGVNGENGTNGTNGNVNGSGNEDNENDSANGNEDGSEKPVETAEDEAKRLAEQQQQEQLRQQEQQRKEEEQQKQLAA